MANQPQGYLTIGGTEQRPFHVGYNQGAIFARLPNRVDEEGRPLSVKAYGELFSLSAIRDLSLSLEDVRDFVYSALASGAMVAKQPVDFTADEVGYWLDEADELDVAKVFTEMGEQTVRRFQNQLERAKNAQAPTQASEAGPDQS